MFEKESLTGSIKDGLYGQLLSSIDQKFEQGENQSMSIEEWAEKTPIVLDGQPFTFNRHEYLKEPYQDDHPHIVEEKAA